ncbi:SanA/YdcF family protein [Actinoallomurus soli]|uniref:SanA/YdcF family protein n=1 Tax=Actinoallomurus soli TaxID=2952535 RepID=UPI0020934B09|nr:ElyC/SanA/YdcF family protein [Actinoallomurus soli]MCO5974776.1 YdcF family protein [Actinoallomurus soli]
MRRFWSGVWRCRAPLAVLGALGGYALYLPGAWMYAEAGHYRTDLAHAPRTTVGMIFGAGAENGKPSRMLYERLKLGAALYRAGKVRVLLVTGDNSRKDYDEPSVMRDTLIAQGVPQTRIVLDYAGFSTWDSCARAKQIFGVDRAILVTQNFHLPRALTLCRAAGIDAWGVGDDSGRYAATATESLYVREIPAVLKATYEVALRPRPYYLGPREAGIRRALDAAGGD